MRSDGCIYFCPYLYCYHANRRGDEEFSKDFQIKQSILKIANAAKEDERRL